MNDRAASVIWARPTEGGPSLMVSEPSGAYFSATLAAARCVAAITRSLPSRRGNRRIALRPRGRIHSGDADEPGNFVQPSVYWSNALTGCVV